MTITAHEWHDLVTVVLTSHIHAYGVIEAERRLRPHLVYWSEPALQALAGIAAAGEGAAA